MRWLALLALLGCGDPLATEAYRGEPIAVLRGVVDQFEPRGDTRAGPMRLAIFWNPAGPRNPGLEGLVEDVRTARPVRFGGLDLAIFEPPTAEHRVAGADPPYALGRLLAYADADRDGRYSSGEPFVGGMIEQGFIYTPTRREPGLTVAPLPAGLSTVALPMPCDQPRPAPSATDCAVPLGAPCAARETCGDGACLRALGAPFVPGVCAASEGGPGCIPAGGAWVPFAFSPQDRGWFVGACTVADDCADPETQRCDPGNGACLGRALVNVVILGALAVPPWCRADWPDDMHYTVGFPRAADGERPPTLPFRPPPALLP